MIGKISVLFLISGMGFLWFQLTQHNQDVRETHDREKNVQKLLENARYFHDLLDFDMAVPLEQNDIAVFDSARCAVQTRSGFFITDDDGKELYRYHLDGSFDRVLAVKGDGPGELGSLQFGTRMYDNQVGFWDLYKSQIIVFSEEGEYQFSLGFFNPNITRGAWMSPGVAFDWPTPDKLILSNILVRDQPEVQSGVTRVHRDDRGNVTLLELEQPFGLRDLEYESKFLSSVAYNFALVGDAYWFGSTAFSAVSYYNVSENHLERLPVSVPDPLTERDYKELNQSDRKKLHWLRNYNGFIHEMIPHPEMVFVKVGIRGYVPFSPDGHQLLDRRLIGTFSSYKGIYNGTLLFISSKKNVGFVEKKTGVPIIDKKSNMAYDEDHPYVVLARLKLEPKVVQKVTK